MESEAGGITGERTAPSIETGADARSRQILAAAYDLLDEEGLDGLTIRAVLKRTGLSRRAVYDRFGAKDDLMIAVFDHTIRLAVDQFAERLRTIDDPVERLRFVISAIVLGRGAFDDTRRRESRIGAAMSREHLRLAEAHPEALQRALAPLTGLIAGELAAAMRAGSISGGDPERLATLIYNLVSTTVHKELMAEDATFRRDDRSQLADELWTFCARAIAPRGPSLPTAHAD